MAPLTLSTDSNEHGWLHPDWSQEEDASPHVIGDQAGEIRQTSFTAVATATSDLLIGKVTGVSGPFDADGVMLESTLVGDRVSTSAYDIDARFLPVRSFFRVQSGYEEAALDMFQRVYGSGGLTLPWQGRGRVHAYYPLRGYGQGFVPDGGTTPYTQNTWGDTYQGIATESYYMPRTALPCRFYVRMEDGVWGADARIMQSPLGSATNVNFQAMQVRLVPGSSIRSRIELYFPGNIATQLNVDIKGTTGTTGALEISGVYRQLNAPTATTITTATEPLTGLSTAGPLGMVIQWGYLSSSDGATLRVKVYAYDPANPPTMGGPVAVLQTDMPNAMRSVITSNNATITRDASGAVGFRDVVISQTDGSWPVEYPVPVEPSLLDIDIDTTRWRNEGRPGSTLLADPDSTAFSMRNGAIHAWEGSGWDYLKMMCTGRALTTRVAGDKLAIRNLFPIDDVQPVSNVQGEPMLSIQAGGRSRSIDVMCHYSPGRRTQSPLPLYRGVQTVIDVNLTLERNKTITYSADLPTGEITLGTVIPYEITDKNGFAQNWNVLFWAGAELAIRVGTDGRLNMEFTGPERENVFWASGFGGTVGAYTGYGPWTINKLLVSNQGYYEETRPITLYTGAPEEMVTREKGSNVDNIFLCTPEDVFDRSTWLISSEGSPRVTLKFDVPSSDRTRYTVGQVVSYGWGLFRVMKVVHSRGTTTVETDWFTPQDLQSANWAGLTASQWDSFWVGKRAYDVFLRPLASPSPITDPQPFVRRYPSEGTNAVLPDVVIPADSIFGTGVFGSGTPFGY